VFAMRLDRSRKMAMIRLLSPVYRRLLLLTNCLAPPSAQP
jgi:hypothetical protein